MHAPNTAKAIGKGISLLAACSGGAAMVAYKRVDGYNARPAAVQVATPQHAHQLPTP